MNKIITESILIILAGASLLFPQEADQGGAEVNAVVRPDKATIGDLLEYRITLVGPGMDGSSILPPEKRECFPEKEQRAQKNEKEPAEGEKNPSEDIPLYIIHNITKDDRSGEGMTDVRVVMRISYYRTGIYSLPELEVRGPDGIKIGYKVPTVEIEEVNKQGQFEEIEPPLDLKGNYYRLIFLIAGAVALALLIFFGVRYVRRVLEERRRAPVIVPAIEIFMKDIKNFQGGRLIDDGRIEDYVFGISMIFRKFLSLQFSFDAMEMTTHEIDRKIRRAFSRLDYDRYHDVIMQSFHLWDLSKFAEFTPSDEILRANLQKTIDLAKNLSGEGDVEDADAGEVVDGTD